MTGTRRVKLKPLRHFQRWAFEHEDRVMSARKTASAGEKAKTVVADDPDNLKGTLKRIGGSQSDHWNNILANQAINSLWFKNSDEKTRDLQCSAAVAGLVGIGPKDELEGMIATQLIAAPVEKPEGSGDFAPTPAHSRSAVLPIRPSRLRLVWTQSRSVRMAQSGRIRL